MSQGYIKFYRKAKNSASWNRGLMYQGLMINLLTRVSWKKGSYQGRDILPGQFGAVMSHLAESLGVPRSTLQRMVAHLEADDFLKMENMGNRFVVITIVNWHIYQDQGGESRATDGQPVVNQRATDGQPSYKEEERKKERKKEDLSASASPDAAQTQPEVFYLTKKKRKLTGKRLESFNRFWAAFGYPRGKAEAADAWLDIPQLTNALVEQIILAAEGEATARPQIVAEGRTPKMAQGWIAGRRWEDGPVSAAPQPPPVTEEQKRQEAVDFEAFTKRLREQDRRATL